MLFNSIEGGDLMNYIIINIVICLFFALIAMKSERKIVNPITIFCSLWGIINLLSAFKLYTLYEVKMKTYNLIFIGIIFYIIGYYMWKFFSKNKVVYVRLKKDKYKIYKNIYVLRYKLMYILGVICILFLIKDIISLGIGVLTNGFNLKEIQRLVRESSISKSNIENAISFLIINPFYTAISVIAAIDFWLGKRDKKLMLITILILVLKVLATGGREPFIKFFFYMIVGYVFTSNRQISIKELNIKNIKKKNKIIFCCIIIGLIIALLILSISRAGENLVKTIYLDFAMQPNMLEHWSNVVDSQKLYGYGFASLNGFFYPILYFAKNLLRIFSNIPNFYLEIYNLIMATDSQWIQIGTEIFANAYVSVFWFLYYDARKFGIAIGMLVYGIISCWSYSFAIKKTTVKSVSIYAMIVVGIFYSFGRMEFATQNYSLAFLFIYFIAYKKNKIKI